jgi:hypothetical protein
MSQRGAINDNVIAGPQPSRLVDSGEPLPSVGP